MTSNVGAKFISEKKQLGFLTNTDNEYDDIKREVNNQIKKEFKPEFLNRIDEIIIFHKLTDEEMKKIFDVMTEKLKTRLKDKRIQIEISEKVKEAIINKEKILEYGARPLKRAIQNNIEDLITDKILSGEIKENMKIKIDIENEKIIVKKQEMFDK